MKYVIGALFAITALLAALVFAQVQLTSPSIGGMEMKKTVALIGLCMVSMLFIFAMSLERIWRLFKQK